VVFGYTLIVLVLILITARDGKKVRMHQRRMLVHAKRPVWMRMCGMEMQSGQQ
jgi:hypothetical protein